MTLSAGKNFQIQRPKAQLIISLCNKLTRNRVASCTNVNHWQAERNQLNRRIASLSESPNRGCSVVHAPLQQVLYDVGVSFIGRHLYALGDLIAESCCSKAKARNIVEKFARIGER